MTHGTLRNKQTGVEIPSEPLFGDPPEGWLYAAIPGDSYGARSWSLETWEYVPPRIPFEEAFNALGLGARFKVPDLDDNDRTYVKACTNGYIALTPWDLNDSYFEGKGFVGIAVHRPRNLDQSLSLEEV